MVLYLFFIVIFLESSSDSVKAIKEALFVLSLDENNTNSKFGVFEENMRQALHGGGSFQNTHNRWFDKALQVYFLKLYVL